jgi:secernin
MCDTWVAMSDATSAGNVMMGKNSDRPIFDCQPLVFYPRKKWPIGSKVKLEYIELPQVGATYTTLGASPYWCWGYEEGINEYSLVIGNEAVFTKTSRELAEAYKAGKNPGLGLLGMNLVRLALERSKTAGQAVELMGSLIETYGQFGSAIPMKSHAEGGYDNSFIIADPNEAWILEAVGKRWTARYVGERYASISNELGVRTEWDLGSPDVENYAIEKGWWPRDKKDFFDFTQAYIDEKVPRQGSCARAMRSQQLLSEKCGRVTVPWMMRIARDHYEGTLLESPYFDAADPAFQSICMHVSPAGFTWGNTASSCIAVLPKSPQELPVFWWTPGPPCNGCYVPFFIHGTKLPESVSNAGRFGRKVVPPPEAEEDKFSRGSYWWLFRRLMDKTKGDAIKSLPGYYKSRNPIVRAQFDAIEMEIEAELSGVLEKAIELRNTGEEAAAGILDKFTEKCVSKVVGALKELLREFD